VAWYRDTPYVIRDPGARPAGPAPRPRGRRSPTCACRAGPAALAAKLDACAAYASQLGFQFGGEAAMRAALARLAAEEGARLGGDGPAEVVALGEPAWALLATAGG
jgi:hypothetical protein